jgi:hypothetical protein
VTELLSGTAEVRVDASGRPRAIRLAGGWRAVSRVANQWLVETDWWRTPVRRHYVRLLLEGRGGARRGAGPAGAAGGDPAPTECVELYRDLEAGSWHWSRRYD